MEANASNVARREKTNGTTMARAPAIARAENNNPGGAGTARRRLASRKQARHERERQTRGEREPGKVVEASHRGPNPGLEVGNACEGQTALRKAVGQHVRRARDDRVPQLPAVGRDVEERVPKHVPEASALGIAVKGGETDHFVAVANDFDVGRAEPENKEEPKSKAQAE